MNAMLTTDLQTHWTAICPLLTISNEREYDRAVKLLNQLLDEIGTNERHSLYSFMDTLGALIEAYEEEHHPVAASSGADMLRSFMEVYDLSQSDLPEIGSQGVVSEVLNGKRELNVKQICGVGVCPRIRTRHILIFGQTPSQAFSHFAGGIHLIGIRSNDGASST
jgi:HTH-type transcriptional regulator / antitoxin HigA